MFYGSVTTRFVAGLAMLWLVAGVTACHTSTNAFVHYQRPTSLRSSGPDIDKGLSPADTLPVSAAATEPSSPPLLIAENSRPSVAYQPREDHVRNPEARRQIRAKWLRQSSLLRHTNTDEYAPRTRDIVPSAGKRKVPGLVKASLGGGVVSIVLLAVGTLSGPVGIVAMLLPLSSVLMGVAGLAKITRRRDEYRGKGWAMSAILLATGALGLALIAAAALATSEIVWK